MSSILSRSYLKSNASFLLCNGQALKATASHVIDGTYSVDSGIGSPKLCSKDELISTPNTTFETKVGFQNTRPKEQLIRSRVLQKLFVDIVAGDDRTKEKSTARFKSMVGATKDTVPGEPTILLPQRFRQVRAWEELNQIWRMNRKVKGFLLKKVRAGYLIAIAGYITFLPFRRVNPRRLANDQFTIDSIGPKKNNMVVL
ncbi:hypothetical protein IFM89_011815 [Coptis chinensis]|uniref:Ribosomal protein S1 n=1 Tax=Coptis chinensis TaxID=261450 RepID=A0A835H4I5_9MAGN|nr:hypothetical protein IFM89_011815 [Coptis chinensis]